MRPARKAGATKMNPSNEETKGTRDWAGIIGLFTLALIFIIAVVYAGLILSSVDQIGALAFLLGSAVLVCGYYHLVYVLPRTGKDVETRVSMEALRVSFWLVIFGLIIIVLGLLNLMNILPP